jgi:hypothetical protein
MKEGQREKLREVLAIFELDLQKFGRGDALFMQREFFQYLSVHLIDGNFDMLDGLLNRAILGDYSPGDGNCKCKVAKVDGHCPVCVEMMENNIEV